MPDEVSASTHLQRTSAADCALGLITATTRLCLLMSGQELPDESVQQTWHEFRKDISKARRCWMPMGRVLDPYLERKMPGEPEARVHLVLEVQRELYGALLDEALGTFTAGRYSRPTPGLEVVGEEVEPQPVAARAGFMRRRF